MALVSGEGVPLELERAGVGSRTVAAALDLALQVVALVVAVLLESRFVAASDGAAFAALVLVELALVLGGYPVLCEWLSRGRTLGKMAMGLRVVRDDGGPIAFRQALVRGLSGFLLEKPGLFAPVGTSVGLLTMIFNPDSKRIGDLMAGTFVVNERAGPRSALLVPGFQVPWALQGWAASLDLSGVDDQLALAVRQFVVRADAFTPTAQYQLAEQLRQRLMQVLTPPPPPGVPTPVFLTSVLAERRRRADSAYLTSRPQPAGVLPAGTYGPPHGVPPTVNPARLPSGDPSAGGFAPPG